MILKIRSARNYYHTFIIAAPLPGPPPALSLVIPDVPLPGPDLASEPAPLIKSEAMTSTSRQNHNNNVIAAEAAEEVDTHHIGNVQLFVNLIFILYARWRLKIVCLQTKLASLAICKKNLISIEIQFSINVVRFVCRNLVSTDFEL